MIAVSSLEHMLRELQSPIGVALFVAALSIMALLEVRHAMAPRDVRDRWPANWCLGLLNVATRAALPLTALLVADQVSRRDLGLLQAVPLPVFAELVLGVLALTFIDWLTHVALHKVPLLWRVHRVHHSDRAFDVSTALRRHPLEMLVYLPVTLAGIVLLGICPFAVVVVRLLAPAFALFQHANTQLPARLERALNKIVVTPHMHRLHHSSRHPETDSNFGAMFSFWDRLFGTYRERPESYLRRMDIGLGQYRDEATDSLGWLLLLPFRTGRTGRTGQTGRATQGGR